MQTKRTFLKLAGTAGALIAAPALMRSAHADEALKEIRIGHQKNGVLMIAKAQGFLEERFKSIGASVKWVEFQYGPPLLEALNAGALDYGTTGDAPPIFAQAARANLLYVAALPARGDSQGIVVPKSSPIQSIEDLRGKKVGIAKASSAHNLTIAALEAAGLQFGDILPQYLVPSDAAAALTRGSIDAWTIWDPFLALAELHRDVRQLPIKAEAKAQNTFFLANREFTLKHPEIVSAINEGLAVATAWGKAHRAEAATLFAEASGVEFAAQKLTVDRTEFNFTPVEPTVIAEQQAVADRFHRLGLIPKAVSVRDIVWTWKPAA